MSGINRDDAWKGAVPIHALNIMESTRRAAYWPPSGTLGRTPSSVDCGTLVKAGLDLNEVAELPDEISTKLLSQILSVQSFDEGTSVIRYTVG